MKAIQFYGETLTQTRVSNNILKVFKAANEAKVSGLDWYLDANFFGKDLAMTHISKCLNRAVSQFYTIKGDVKIYWQPLTKYHIYGIISALSPMQNWNRNKELTVEFVRMLESGEDLYNLPYMKGQISKAIKVAELKGLNPEELKQAIANILNGEKTVSFFYNIAEPFKSERVTVDRHAMSIALGKKLSNEQFKTHKMTKSQYKFFVAAYQRAAAKMNIKGLEMQAQTWEFWRINGENFQKNLNNLLQLK